MSANDSQVGGNHYHRSIYQHWDMAADFHLGWPEYQITKYVTRHRFKKGKEDLMKALHFAHKLTELHQHKHWRFQHDRCTAELLHRYREANDLTITETDIIEDVLRWTCLGDLRLIARDIKRLIEREYPSVSADQAAAVDETAGLMPTTAAGFVASTVGQALGSNGTCAADLPATDGSEPDTGYVDQDRQPGPLEWYR